MLNSINNIVMESNTKSLRHLGISGGGFSIPGLAGAFEQIVNSGYKPDIVSGVSSGSILAFVYCGATDPLKLFREETVGFNADVAFKHPPMAKNGLPTIRSIWNLITKNYLASQDNLEITLRKYVSEEEWNVYRNDEAAPECLIMAVDFLTGARRKYNLKEAEYEDAIQMVRASSSIPVFADPVEFDGDYLYDGGVRNHIATEWILENYNISETVSVFNRPADFTKYVDQSELTGTLSILMRTLLIMEYEISKSDERLADLIAKEKGIKSTNIYLPTLLKDTYDADIQKQILLYEAGIENAKAAGFTLD